MRKIIFAEFENKDDAKNAMEDLGQIVINGGAAEFYKSINARKSALLAKISEEISVDLVENILKNNKAQKLKLFSA